MPGPSVRLRLGKLTQRREFLAVARSGAHCAMPGVVMQARRWRPDEISAASPTFRAEMRVGLTATRKIGGATTRNRAKRRLRAAAGIVLSVDAAPARDYVLIARTTTPTRRFHALLADIRGALCKMRALRDSGRDSGCWRHD